MSAIARTNDMVNAIEHTVFIQTVATATINFNPARVRLLFKGGYYSGCGYYSSKYGKNVNLHKFQLLRFLLVLIMN